MQQKTVKAPLQLRPPPQTLPHSIQAPEGGVGGEGGRGGARHALHHIPFSVFSSPPTKEFPHLQVLVGVCVWAVGESEGHRQSYDWTRRQKEVTHQDNEELRLQCCRRWERRTWK